MAKVVKIVDACSSLFFRLLCPSVCPFFVSLNAEKTFNHRIDLHALPIRPLHLHMYIVLFP